MTGIDTGEVERLIEERMRVAYALVAEWPERKPDGLLNLLALRNMAPEAADTIAALREKLKAAERSNVRWQKNSQETWHAMQTMRNSINEHIPMPSTESDLLQGPENSIFCAAVAEAVISTLTEARAGQAAAWEAGLSQQMPHDFIGVWHFVTEWCAKNDETVEAQTAWGEVVQFLRSTPPADLSTALQAVKDAELERAAAVADEEAKRHLWDARHAGHGQQERAKASACWSAADMVAQRIRALRRAAPTGGEG